VDSLAALAKQHGIDDARWHFVRTEPEKVRELAALLGIRYRAAPDGEISHSPTVALLDREGVIATRMENAAGDPTPLIAATAQVASVATP
jgi:protein SCO1/2